MLAACACLVTACAGSRGSSEGPRITSLDSGLTEPCAQGSVPPDKDLSQAEIERYWRRDRISLRNCRLRHKALVDEVEKLHKGLEGRAPAKRK